MRDSHDKYTMEIGELPRLRGRPATGQAMTAAERQRKFREKNNLKSFTVHIDTELWCALESYQIGKNLTKSAVVEKLLKTQLLRKR
jgi:hypothetical protein